MFFFYIYKGKLVEHEGEPSTHDEEEFVEGDYIHISFIKKDTFDIDEDYSDESYSDYSSYEDEEEDLDLADDEANECRKGTIEDNIIISIATFQGLNEEESLVLVFLIILNNYLSLKLSQCIKLFHTIYSYNIFL
jgi:hypothetical protein